MIVYANNEEITLSKGSTLFNLLQIKNIKNTNGLAIAVNNEIIPKNNWDIQLLKNKDTITLITATQGG